MIIRPLEIFSVSTFSTPETKAEATSLQRKIKKSAWYNIQKKIYFVNQSLIRAVLTVFKLIRHINGLVSLLE